jgi:hypothetical protein
LRWGASGNISSLHLAEKYGKEEECEKKKKHESETVKLKGTSYAKESGVGIKGTVS